MPLTKTVFEISVPGMVLLPGSVRDEHEIETLLSSTISSFYEANTALWLFTDAIEAKSRRSDARKSLDEIIDSENAQRKEIYDQLIEERGSFFGIHAETELIFKKRRLEENVALWKEGKLPTEFESNLPLLYAHGFLFALDYIERFLSVLADNHDIPTKAQEAIIRISAELPQIRDIRNSAHHKEDRIRGLATSKKQIAFPNNIHAIILSGLVNRTLTYTVASGHILGLDVTDETLRIVHVIIQDIINAFAWEGIPSSRPYYR